MKKVIVRFFQLIALASVLSACVSTGPVKSVIPIYSMQSFSQSGQYFKYIKYVSDNSMLPFASENGVKANVAVKAQDAGASAVIIKKVYERYVRGGISGNNLFVDGIAIIPVKATKSNLLRDLNTLKSKALPVYQVAYLMNFIRKQNIREAVPIMRQILVNNKFYHKSEQYITTAYVEMADEEVSALVKLMKTKAGFIKNIAVQVLSKHGNKKQAPLFLTLIKSGGSPMEIYAAQGLKRVGGKKYSSDWKKILQYHSNVEVRKIAAEVLIKFGERKVVENIAMQTSNQSFKKTLNALLLN